MGYIFLIHVMLAYVLYSKDLGLVFKVLSILRNENLKFDIDLNCGNIYINEAEATQPKLKIAEILGSVIVPRKCFLRTVEFFVNLDGNIGYGPKGSGVSTSSSLRLLERIKNTTLVEIMKGFIYYPQRKAFWIIGEGYFPVDKFKKELLTSQTKVAPKTLRCWEILKKLITID